LPNSETCQKVPKLKNDTCLAKLAKVLQQICASSHCLVWCPIWSNHKYQYQYKRAIVTVTAEIALVAEIPLAKKP
jgi:hypothetical protein